MKSEIWPWYRGFYKVYLEDSEKKRQIAGWQGCKEHCKYFLPDGRQGWDVIFPSRLYDKVARIVSLPLKKRNPKRVLHAQRLGLRAKFENRLEIQNTPVFSNS